MATDNIATIQADLDAQTVEHDGYSYTVGLLRSTFGRCVTPGAGWKAAIHVLAESEDEARLLTAAIEFHVGGPTTRTVRTFNYRGETVTRIVLDNAGYYQNIGA